MNQHRLRAYLNLIQQLLACPNGEEWILLRQHETLVTPELVQIMEQVATQLASQGNPKEAKFLHNLAGQIHHLFVAQTVSPPEEEDHGQAYIDLIKALLECPKGAEDDLLATYSGLIGPGLVYAMQQVATQLAANGDQKAAHYLQFWAEKLSRLWLQAHDFQPPAKPEPDSPRPSSAWDAPSETTSVPRSPRIPQSPMATAAEPPLAEAEEDYWADVVEPVESASEALSSETPAFAGAEVVGDHDGSQSPEQTLYVQINRHLQTIADALTQMSATLTPVSHPPTDPLWYMDVLERAHVGHWILTSSEIQQLIGVKPSCSHNEDTFQRGCWLFVKAGKLGAQTAWRVEKTDVEIG
jgi:hypothetical protein